MTTPKIAALAACALASIAAPVIAQSNDMVVEGKSERPYVIVRYGELNLANAKGVDILNRRIRHAAEALCLDPGSISLFNWSVGRDCMGQSIAEVQPQVRQAIALYGQKKVAIRNEIRVALAR